MIDFIVALQKIAESGMGMPASGGVESPKAPNPSNTTPKMDSISQVRQVDQFNGGVPSSMGSSQAVNKNQYKGSGNYSKPLMNADNNANFRGMRSTNYAK